MLVLDGGEQLNNISTIWYSPDGSYAGCVATVLLGALLHQSATLPVCQSMCIILFVQVGWDFIVILLR